LLGLLFSSAQLQKRKQTIWKCNFFVFSSGLTNIWVSNSDHFDRTKEYLFPPIYHVVSFFFFLDVRDVSFKRISTFFSSPLWTTKECFQTWKANPRSCFCVVKPKKAQQISFSFFFWNFSITGVFFFFKEVKTLTIEKAEEEHLDTFLLETGN
jgi:hypothetical protein